MDNRRRGLLNKHLQQDRRLRRRRHHQTITIRVPKKQRKAGFRSKGIEKEGGGGALQRNPGDQHNEILKTGAEVGAVKKKKKKYEEEEKRRFF